ncbi:alpha/beta fold hydrolase [Paralimibaculum aggregatum]|uniref:Alpha/beta fold hydrolase n=1 Tax=Paralimibaculum aggregatum TaxID=3036245 RepID=A0ABQ6LNB1_9RHOB|nr:alpha/beta fold hydrolase [Limibaculum sp. NKW23]GMG84492.1 alpha/beta fold hydrolase [Limibaculum sp. NKW23]
MRFLFADCVLDTKRHRLLRSGEPVPVEPQVFDLLHVLAERAGELVTKDELIAAVWNGRIVSDATIASRINAARTAVGDSGRHQLVIRTLPRRGFALVAEVSRGSDDRPQGAPEMRQTVRMVASSDGTGIAYAVSGAGPPLLRAGHFLTHLEMDWQGSVYRPTIAALSARHTLVRYDQRGTGLSQTDVADLSIEAYAADMLAVADAAGLDRFPIFATSQGVPVSVHVAAAHPERVSRLVLFGGFAQGRALRSGNRSHGDAEALMTLLNRGWGKPESGFMSAFIAMFCPDASPEERTSIARSQLASATPEMAGRIRRAIDRFDVTESLAKVRAPTLVMHADGDAIHPVAQGRLLAANIPGAEFKLIHSNNHIILGSSCTWDEIISKVIEFINI